MKTETEDVLRFVPSSSKGWPEVTEVVVRPDRLEFQTAGEWKIVAFEDMAQLPYSRRKYVGERDYYHKFFVFYTKPRLMICLPAEEDVRGEHSLFRRIQCMLLEVGYATWDLG